MPDVLLRIDLSQPEPAYRQIADSLRASLVSGRLRADDRLPSSRSLAEDLGVHFNTVAEAYRILAEEGWLRLQRGSGAVVVARDAPPKASRAAMIKCSTRLRRLLAEMLAVGMAPADIVVEFDHAIKELSLHDGFVDSRH